MIVEWLKEKALLISAFLLLVASAGAVVQTLRLQVVTAEREQLAQQVEQVKGERDKAQSDLRDLGDRVSRNIEQLAGLGDELSGIAAESKKAREVFEKHDLSKLLQEKPGLIQSRARAATVKVWTTIEQESQQF